MKKIILIFIFMINLVEAKTIKKANTSFEQDDLVQSTIELMQAGYHFAAAEVLSLHLNQTKKIDSTTEELIEKLILKTGVQSFSHLKTKKALGLSSNSLNLVMAFKFFKARRYNKVEKLTKGQKGKRLEPEALYLSGSAFELLNNHDNANMQYDKCIQVSASHASSAKKEKLKRYFEIIKENCITHKARLNYKKKQFNIGIEQLNKIDKTSYLWPYTLKEKAWHNYHIKDYNRMLGLLVTYKAPLLNSYFTPEIEYMNALAYFRLCQYEDALTVINRYYNHFKPKSQELKKFILPHKRSNKYFLKIALTSTAKVEQKSPYLRQVITQLKKKVKFSLDLTNYRRIINEYQNLKKFKKSNTLISFLKKRLRIEANYRGIYLNHFVKKELFDFLNEMHRYSFELFNIKIDVLAEQRNVIYNANKTKTSAKRGDLTNVKKAPDEFLYKFNGEFWADELGDYSFGLKNKCASPEV